MKGKKKLNWTETTFYYLRDEDTTGHVLLFFVWYPFVMLLHRPHINGIRPKLFSIILLRDTEAVD